MRYHSVEPITRSEAEAVFATGQPEKILYALLSVVYHDPDWRWAQSLYLDYAHHAHTDLRGLAITCLGHLARIHGVLDRDSSFRCSAQPSRTGNSRSVEKRWTPSAILVCTWTRRGSVAENQASIRHHVHSCSEPDS